MTAYSLRSKGKAPKASNKKDGFPPGRRMANWEAHGFVSVDWNAWSYTWEGVFPQFCIAPGIIEDKAGLVARCDNPETLILFPYGTSPVDIKGQLDKEILQIMRLDDALVDDEIDIDEYMADLNASADDRLLYRRPAVQELAGHYGLTIDLGLEIYLERGE